LSVLVVAEQLRGRLRDVTRELVTAAQELDGPVALAVIGREPARFDAGLAGVDEIVQVDVEPDEFENDVYQAAVETLIRERRPRVVLAGFTVNSMGFAAAVAVKLGLGFASDVHALRVEDGELVATRSFYGAKVNGDVDFPGKETILLLLRPTAWPPAEPAGGQTVTQLSVSAPPSRARHREFVEVPPADVDITTADFLLSIGRGIGDKDAIPDLEQLAERMGAVLSVSRPLVDAGWIPSARQVGQSGKTVKAKLYLALGISGAVQHLAGIKGCGTIVAVNTDPEAAIFNVAHYGAVADLFDVAEELEKLF
jgi:electron transfer flavoprotein alpha subunit